MIRLIEARHFRCLRWIRQSLGPFHVLVGPNASGKTTFLDVVAFLGRLVADGLEAAIAERTMTFEHLLWQGQGDLFEVAVELDIPEDRRQRLKRDFAHIRYEVRIGLDPDSRELSILEERAMLKPAEPEVATQRAQFPQSMLPPDTIMTSRRRPGTRTVLSKTKGEHDHYYLEVPAESGKGWFPAIRLGPRKSTLQNLPEDESGFPVSTWLKATLTGAVQAFVLNSQAMRRASPPGQPRGFRPDGSNLPWVVEELRRTPDRFHDWVEHLRVALPDLEDIETQELPDTRHRFLVLVYRGGLRVPSWTASDGTLRLLALTLPAYLTAFEGVYLIEEPENGIHPMALETVFQSLSSVYDAQILVATHSPVILTLAEPEQVLCFQKTPEGATDIVRGSEHPRLHDWRREVSLGDLFAAGVLGWAAE